MLIYYHNALIGMAAEYAPFPIMEEKMKKRIGVILLVSLLLASSVFAASVFTGKAQKI